MDSWYIIQYALVSVFMSSSTYVLIYSSFRLICFIAIIMIIFIFIFLTWYLFIYLACIHLDPQFQGANWKGYQPFTPQSPSWILRSRRIFLKSRRVSCCLPCVFFFCCCCFPRVLDGSRYITFLCDIPKLHREVAFGGGGGGSLDFHGNKFGSPHVFLEVCSWQTSCCWHSCALGPFCRGKVVIHVDTLKLGGHPTVKWMWNGRYVAPINGHKWPKIPWVCFTGVL